MMQMVCPGLPAAWINAWLAAVGATVLDPRIRLHWTTGGTPVAVLSAAEAEPLTILVVVADEACLADLPLAENWKRAASCNKARVEAFAAELRAAMVFVDSPRRR